MAQITIPSYRDRVQTLIGERNKIENNMKLVPSSDLYLILSERLSNVNNELNYCFKMAKRYNERGDVTNVFIGRRSY